MRKVIIVLLMLVNLLAGSTVPTKASGFIANNIFVEAVPTESKAVIVYDGKKEIIFDSLTFNINPTIAWSFGWIIAVPSKPKVEIVQDELYTKFEKVSEKKLKKNHLVDHLRYFGAIENENVPPSLYTRPVEIFKIQTFNPSQPIDELKKYLGESGYILPKSSLPLLNEYREKGWHFVVADINANHMQADAKDSLTVTGAHSLPLKIEFETDKIVYPQKLVRVIPDFDSENIVLNYDYGTTSTAVLGTSDEIIDSMLTIQSKNKYPRLPIDYTYHKTELFIISDKKVESKGFINIFSSYIDPNSIEFKDFSGNTYLELPNNKTFLTRIYSFSPVLQIDDAEITGSDNNVLVNTTPPFEKQLVNVFAALSLLLLAVFHIKKIYLGLHSNNEK